MFIIFITFPKQKINDHLNEWICFIIFLGGRKKEEGFFFFFLKNFCFVKKNSLKKMFTVKPRNFYRKKWDFFGPRFRHNGG